MADATLLISSKNYSSWSLRGFLLCHLARLPFEEKAVEPDDPRNLAELLLRSSSIRVPCLIHDGVTVWDTLAIAEYLNETFPDAGMLPATAWRAPAAGRSPARCIPAFPRLRSSLPMNLRTASVRTSRCGPRRRPISTGSPRSGANAWRPGTARGCSAASPRRRRDVRAGRHPLPQLRRRAGRAPARRIAHHVMKLGADAGVDRGRAAGAGANRGTGRRVLRPPGLQAFATHGVGAGTAQGPSTSSVLKSAGATTSRYSMSGE